MKTRTARNLVKASIPALLLSLTLITSGCSGINSSGWGLRKGGLRARMVLAELERRVSIENGPVTQGPLTGFDISNPGGSVTIVVDDRYPDATVQSQVRYEDRHRRAAEDEGWEFDFRGPWFTAVHEEGAENGRVVIRPTDHVLADGTRPFVDLVIRTPVCDGVRILSRFGEVDVRGARGEISIDTSSDVTLNTTHRLIDKLTIRSSDGDIEVLTVPESAGTFLLTAPRGRANFNSNFGEVQQARPRTGEWSGIWNGGANPVTLHSDNGNVVYFVTETPSAMTIGPLF